MDTEKVVEPPSFLSTIATEVFQSPLNIALLSLIGFLVYRIIKTRQDEQRTEPEEKPIPKMKKKDFTVAELKNYDGTQEDGRVLMAVNGRVYDVTKGKRFYGPGMTPVILTVSNLYLVNVHLSAMFLKTTLHQYMHMFKIRLYSKCLHCLFQGGPMQLLLDVMHPEAWPHSM